ncbi:MAG TPA: ATP-binding protein [Candidatus Saccharimonadales bacterium]|nr:ATP-binding protein [Candidatus Saccharimonadales bacterium]
MEALIFAGVQGSGKTTFYRERFFDTHVRISLDMVRTRHREQLLLAACLAAKQPFVIDNTNPLPSDRARYIGPAREAGFRLVAYFFETSLADAIRRNRQRTGKQRIPIPAIAGTIRKMQAPSVEEGFDAVYRVTISPEGAFSVREYPDHPTWPTRRMEHE